MNLEQKSMIDRFDSTVTIVLVLLVMAFYHLLCILGFRKTKEYEAAGSHLPSFLFFAFFGVAGAVALQDML